jgi:hypothetical protein
LNAQALRLADVRGDALANLERSDVITLVPDDFSAAARVLGEQPERLSDRPSFWRRRR